MKNNIIVPRVKSKLYEELYEVTKSVFILSRLEWFITMA